MIVNAPARIPKWAWRSGVHPVELANRIGAQLEGKRGAPLPYDASIMANALAGGEPDIWLLIERMQPELKDKQNSDEGVRVRDSLRVLISKLQAVLFVKSGLRTASEQGVQKARRSDYRMI